MIDSLFNNELQNLTKQKTQFVTKNNKEFYVNDSNWFIYIYTHTHTYIHAVWSREFTCRANSLSSKYKFGIFFTVYHSIELFHLPTLMHYSLLINNMYSYTTILDMFRALTCPSSGGPIVFSQHLVTLFSVNGCIVHRSQRGIVQPFTESDVTRCCENTIGLIEDRHFNARNMSRIVV
jgi:hypothetical protein